MHAVKTKTGCFQGKTIPQTEHKKHYRTLQIGDVWGVCPRVWLCLTSPSCVPGSAFRFGSSNFHANENVYSSLRYGTHFAIAFFHEDTDLAELLIALIQQFIGWHIT